MGGCVLGAEVLGWPSLHARARTRCRPTPSSVGETWRARWLERLEGTPPFLETWLAHQRRDAFWKQGSICEDFGAVTCPIYMVGRLGRRLHERDPAHARRAVSGRHAVQGADRAMGARVPRGRDARAADRVPAGVAALVGSLAEGRGHGDHGRADPARLDAGAGAALDELRRAPRTLDRRAIVAVPAHRRAAPLADGGEWARARARRRRTGRDARPRGRRRGRRHLVPVRRDGRLPRRSARRGRARRVLHVGAARASASRCSAPRSSSSSSPRIGRRRTSPCASRMSLPTARRCCLARAAQPLPSRLARSHRAAGARERQCACASCSTSPATRFDPGHRLRLAVSPTYWPFAWPSPEIVTLRVSVGDREQPRAPRATARSGRRAARALRGARDRRCRSRQTTSRRGHARVVRDLGSGTWRVEQAVEMDDPARVRARVRRTRERRLHDRRGRSVVGSGGSRIPPRAAARRVARGGRDAHVAERHGDRLRRDDRPRGVRRRARRCISSSARSRSRATGCSPQARGSMTAWPV